LRSKSDEALTIPVTPGKGAAILDAALIGTDAVGLFVMRRAGPE